MITVLIEARYLKPGDRVSADDDVYTVRKVWKKHGLVGLGFVELGILLLMPEKTSIAKIKGEKTA